MIRLSHFAAPAVLGAAVLFGAQGCTHEHPDTVPANAAELSSGTQEVSATAPKDGTVYVYDITSNKPLYVGNVNKGDTIRVDARENKLFLNDKMVTERDDLRNSHRYTVFFDQSEMDRERQHAYERARENGSTTMVQPAPAAPAPAGTSMQVQPAAPQSSRGYNNGTTVQVQPAPQSSSSSGTSIQVQPQSSGGTSVQVQPAPQPAPQSGSSNSGGTTVVVPPAPAR